MNEIFEKTRRRLLHRLAWLSRAAWSVMLVENLSGAFWGVFFWCAGFAGLWMTDLPSLFGETGLYAANIVFLAGFFFFIRKGFIAFHLPRSREILRRIETDSGLANRPLSSIDDRLVNTASETARSLWFLRWETIFNALRQARVPRPAALLSRADPKALRVFAALLLVCGISIAGPQWWDRLENGLMPYRATMTRHAADTIALWITPPAYTGAAQMILNGAASPDKPLEIPAGSKIKVRVNGGFGRPSLVMGNKILPLPDLGGGTYGMDTDVAAGDFIRIKQMFLYRVSLPYHLIPDNPPKIAIDGKIETLDHGQIRIPVTLSDDYGVRDMSMTMNLDPVVSGAPLGSPAEDVRAIMSQPGTETKLHPVYDMTAHPWAGLPVTILMRATDGTGQTGDADIIKMTLPEREFRHPIARKLIELRKKLAWTPVASSGEVSDALESLLDDPAAFGGDPIVFLALRAASSRLYYSPTMESAQAVIALLWDTALRIEDGNLSLAARNLRNAQNSLQKTLDNPNASQEDIAQAMENMRNAMAEYFMEMQREMQKRMADGQQMPMIPPDMLNQSIDPQTFSDFMKQMQEQALSGDRDSARQMLSQLQRLMDMMDPSAMSMPLPPDMEFMNKAQNALQDLVKKQEELLNQTRRQAQGQNQPPPDFSYGQTLPQNENTLKSLGLDGMPPAPQYKNGAKPEARNHGIDTRLNKNEQEALRHVLGELMREAGGALGEVPENMGQAELEMRQSSAGLGQNRPDLSIPHQEKTLEYLKQAQQGMGQKMAQRMKQMAGMFFGGGRMDPLGRPYRNDENAQPGLFGSRVKIPDAGEKKRVDEILNVLRRRSGELQRPEPELEYFRRLLKQF